MNKFRLLFIYIFALIMIVFGILGAIACSAGIFMVNNLNMGDASFSIINTSLQEGVGSVNTLIKELTWTNVNDNLGAFDFKFYKNGQAVGDLYVTYTAPSADRTVGYGYYSFPTNVLYEAGDELYVQYSKPSGTGLKRFQKSCCLC